MSLSAISVFDFTDFRKFLSAFHQDMQERDKSYTRSRLCKELGLPNSRGYFGHIVSGLKPVSKNYVERFVQVLGLDDDEAQYFRVLVDFNQSTFDKEREQLFDRLVSMNRTPKKIVDPEAYEFYRHWHHTTVFSLLDVLDFNGDFAHLAKRVFPPITVGQARESVALLTKLGLVEKNKEGVWKPVAKTLDTGSYARNEMITQYQLQCFDLAKKAMLLKTKQPRNFSTVTLSVSGKGLALIEKKLQKFKSEVRSIAHRETDPADRVYQMNVQFFPQSTPETAS